MSTKSVICLVESRPVAELIVERLTSAGFPIGDISVLLSDQDGTRDLSYEKHTKAPEGIATGAGTGGILGGTVGALAGIGLLAVPGVGPFLAAGPIMASLSGAALGATLGGVAGGLVGLGIPEYEAKRYNGKVEDGHVLISVHTQNGDETARAVEILKASEAKDIAVTAEAAVS